MRHHPFFSASNQLQFCLHDLAHLFGDGHSEFTTDETLLVVANSYSVVADGHSNKDEQPDTSFAEKPTLLPPFCWSGY
jgi:hypothetical protein